METLSKHFKEITRVAFARYGFAAADAVANWEAIVGSELAGVSAPERIKWPRGASDQQRKQGGTLVIRAAPGQALGLQYEASRIIARINSYFGYGAIAAIKVVQGSQPIGRVRTKPPLPEKYVFKQQVESVEDDPLRTALERLGRGVATTRRSSPQGK
ncbi:DUF721 domain-containing protein [Aestuariivirga sp.]|jgi:hypothetical protein|uniref:DUF721 domain-containing protein n=1 Tax=Aestuariivirga sp. TaxID=2650926 RepID=UPI003784274D